MLFNCFLKISCFEPSVAYKKGCSSKRVKTTKGAFPLKILAKSQTMYFYMLCYACSVVWNFLAKNFVENC